MDKYRIIGKSIPKKESFDKVTGRAIYTADKIPIGVLHVKMATSKYAHAIIKNIDLSNAYKVKGVRAILTGENCQVLTGEEIRDRPIIAINKVRYFGETVAVVVADSEFQAKKAVDLIKIEYEPLPVVNSPLQAYQEKAVLVHENIEDYEKIAIVQPVPNTNIANWTKIRKGNMDLGWEASEVIVEEDVAFSQSDHAAMETRTSQVEILPDGSVIIETTTQSPYMVKQLVASYFHIPNGKIIVKTPFVGGGYGGKSPVQLEFIAYLASKAVGGRKVKIVNTREEDLITSPVHIGLHAKVKLGSTRFGKIQAAEILFLFDGGAYSDKAVDVTRAAAVDSSGPYSIENLWCDSMCMYTNHPYATAYRGFGHSELTFAIERTMDRLAEKLDIDPLELRYKNAIVPGDTTPTRAPLTESNLGSLPKSIIKLRELMEWDKWQIMQIDETRIRAKGISCFWKTSNIDTDSSSQAVITFNRDGSINLNCGVVEIGTGTKTVIAQILAERMKMPIEKVHVKFEVDTQVTPEHWKTVASRGTFMAGRAVIEATNDAIRQLVNIGAIVLRCSPEDLEVGWGKVFLRANPNINVDVSEICYGYKYPNGNAIGGQILGRGSYILRGLTYLDPETGAGKPGPEWTAGAQGVEIELDTSDYNYKILKAYTVIDIGQVLNRKGAKGQIMGGMKMGLSFGNRETFIFNNQGIILNRTLRNYNLTRYGEHPEYIVDFVETPYIESPYGARGIGEHGVIGMPAALANGLSRATGMHLNQLPLIPEYIWDKKMRGKYDSF